MVTLDGPRRRIQEPVWAGPTPARTNGVLSTARAAVGLARRPRAEIVFAGGAMELVKGTLDVLILKTLSEGPMHGYAISQTIREISEDVLSVEEGALYPALRRLEKKGWLSARWGTTDTGREAKFYELTAAGKKQLARQLSSWGRYVEAMGRVLYGTDR